MEQIKKYGRFEAAFTGDFQGENPFAEVEFTATFTNGKVEKVVRGFYDGENTWRIRFMPEMAGAWEYKTSSNLADLDGRSGSLECLEEAEGHGKVEVWDKYYLQHADGTPHISIGTTCYAWTYQPLERQEQTIETLKNSPFNKIRMCVFPKWYEHNYDKTLLMFPYEGDTQQGFDYDRPNLEYFRLYEKRVEELAAIGVQADIILFHPYENREKWNFNYMNPQQDFNYLKYIIARLGACQNVWWSMANEWDIFQMNRTDNRKSEATYWKEMGELVQQEDPYNHLRGIHNCMSFYDHSEAWITHCSVQRVDYYKTAEYTNEWRDKWQKPIVYDECTYEGDIDHCWGNITGEEMTRRFWEGTIRGGYMGHSETYSCPEDILWWSHGGVLKGSSPARIQFMKELLEEYPQYHITMLQDFGDYVCGGQEKDYYLFYTSIFRPSIGHYNLPISREYEVEVIDTWNMTRQKLEGTYAGAVDVELPAKQYMLVRCVSVGERDLSGQKITLDTTFADAFELAGGAALQEILASQMGGEEMQKMLKFMEKMPIRTMTMAGMNEAQIQAMLDQVND